MTDWLGRADLLDVLEGADLDVEGRLSDASNTTLRCRAEAADGATLLCVVKPVAGERPLWDFPQWTLTRRELAAHALSEALGWDLVPPTVWREDGPGGPGMCQLWIEEDREARLVDVVRPDRVPSGWRHVLDAHDHIGERVALVHADLLALQHMAAFDVLANNADRKGGHVLSSSDGRIWGIDHGVTFAVEDKLRTVLWGWAGEPVDEGIRRDVADLGELLADGYDPVDRWLDDEERDALRSRVRSLTTSGMFPVPSGRWPAIPWPVF